jgi:hypothetical protein
VFPGVNAIASSMSPAASAGDSVAEALLISGKTDWLTASPKRSRNFVRLQATA